MKSGLTVPLIINEQENQDEELVFENDCVKIELPSPIDVAIEDKDTRDQTETSERKNSNENNASIDPIYVFPILEEKKECSNENFDRKFEIYDEYIDTYDEPYQYKNNLYNKYASQNSQNFISVFNNYFTPSEIAIASLELIAAFSFSLPTALYALTAPFKVSPGGLTVALMALSPGTTCLALLCAGSSGYIHVKMYKGGREGGTIRAAWKGIKNWWRQFSDHPIRNLSILGLAITGGTAQGIIANYTVRNWAPLWLTYYMTFANIGGFGVIRCFAMNESAERWDKEFAPLSRCQRIKAIFQLKNLFAASIGTAITPVYGEKLREACTFIGFNMKGLPIWGINLICIPLSNANFVSYFSQSQQYPHKLYDKIRYDIAGSEKITQKATAFCKSSLPMLGLTGFSCVSGASLATDSLSTPDSMTASYLSSTGPGGNIVETLASVGVFCVTGKLFLNTQRPKSALNKPTPVKKNL